MQRGEALCLAGGPGRRALLKGVGVRTADTVLHAPHLVRGECRASGGLGGAATLVLAKRAPLCAEFSWKRPPAAGGETP